MMSSQGVVGLRDWQLGGNNPFFLIAGPCVIESQQHCLDLAGRLKEITDSLDIPFIFKASFDKANRTSMHSYRGPGLEKGLEILRVVRQSLDVPVLSDVHRSDQVEAAAEVLDVLQIPAFLSRQTDLVVSAAASRRVVNLKKGPFLAPWDVEHVVDKARSAGAQRVMVTERGVSFGYNTLVVDFRSLPIMRAMGIPVVFDASHSLQLPGGLGGRSGGQPEHIPCLARAAVAVGVDGLFVEVHDRPEEALSDGPIALPLQQVQETLQTLKEIDRLVKGC